MVDRKVARKVKVMETLVKENAYFAMYERTIPGKTVYVIFRKGATALEEVKTMRGGGHTTRGHASDEVDRLTCIEMYRQGLLVSKP